MFQLSKTRRALAVFAAAALALTASACADKGGSSSTGPGAADQTLVIETDPVATLTENFNPFLQTSMGYQLNATGLIYEPLLQWNITKPNAYYPWLANSFKWNSDGTAITFKLRSGVKWSDGQPFTASDVAYTFNLMKQHPALNAAAVPITGAVAADPTTVTITFSSPQFSDLYSISGQTFIVPQHVWRSQSSPTTWADPLPVGTGPYTLSNFSTQGLTLKANPGYWGGESKVPEISMPAYVSNTIANQALESGQVDWACNYVTNIQQTYVDKNPGQNHYYFPTTNTVVLVFNTTSAPFNDVAVRRAVNTAINRTQLSQVGETDYEPAATSSSGLLLPEFAAEMPSGLADNLSATSDPGSTAAAMTGAGYAEDSKGIWAKGGKEVSFTIEDPSSYTDYYTDATLIAQQLEPLGFNVSVNGTTSAQWTADLQTGSFQATIHWGASGPTPYTQYEAWLDYGASAAIGENANGDYGRYDSPRVQSALQSWASTNDPATITRDLSTVANAMAADVPDSVLLYGAGWSEYSTAKYTGWPTASNSYIDPRANNPWLEVTVLHLRPVS